ncbi:Uncharacterized protein FWK35_00017869, partial [Aphis craccivora]
VRWRCLDRPRRAHDRCRCGVYRRNTVFPVRRSGRALRVFGGKYSVFSSAPLDVYFNIILHNT